MASLPFILKLFSSCFTTNEEPVCYERNRGAHGRTQRGYSDSLSSFSDSDSVSLSSSLFMSCSENDCDSSRVANASTINTITRNLHESDVRYNQRKRHREDSLHLFNTLARTDQEASYFANLTARDGEEPRRKRRHVSLPCSDESSDEERDMPISSHVVEHTVLKKSQAHLSTKRKDASALLRKELNYVKSQLNIAQVRCELLQEENRWLRENMSAEEDSLLRCEVEMLLAKKAQLALENANLTRERERLLQLVEYLQMEFPSIDYN